MATVEQKHEKRTRATYAKWGVLGSLKIWEAAVLMSGFDPHEIQDITVPTEDPTDTTGSKLDFSWFERALISAVNRSDIQSTVGSAGNVSGQTEIDMDSFIEWAKDHGLSDVANGLKSAAPFAASLRAHLKGSRWSEAELDALASYRTTHTADETAAKYGMSSARVRALLAKHIKSKATSTLTRSSIFPK